jgi:hypothetical protein
MGTIAARIARRYRTPVRLNLDELEAVLAGGNPRRDRDLASARDRLGRARQRRRQAVARAAR